MRYSIYICISFFVFYPSPLFSQEAIDFDDYFIDATMRIDYFHTGNNKEEGITIDQIYRQGIWAGNPDKLLAPVSNGRYTIKVIDIASNRRIYSQHFLSVMFEYKSTDKAKTGIKRTFHESALIPCPRKPFLFLIERRDRQNILHPLLIRKIDPAETNIRREEANSSDKVFVALENGPPHDKVDLVIVAEGYTAEQWEKFKRDVQRLTDTLLNTAPFGQYREKLNIRGVFRPSADSGVDEPTKGLFRNTVVNASYNALDASHYCLVNDNKSLRDIASRVPYDNVIVLANSTRYGGGGFYNINCIITADDERSPEIFIHEFGHSFAGLADEYINESYFDSYNTRGVEPLEPNITAYLNPDNLKWKHLLTPGIELPTPADEKYDGKVGLFEGAGYTKTGMFRSGLHCVMGAGGVLYCKVCQEAIRKVIEHYSN